MRKQLVIGLSVLALTGLGGVSKNSVHEQSQSVTSKYIHFVRTCQNQTFEPLSGASLYLGLPNRNSFQTASVSFITGGKNLDFGNIDFGDPTIEQCQKDGYSLTNCGSGLFPGLKCPYNSAYFDKCCDSRYKYDKSACSYPNTVSGDSCGGKFMCYCDRSLYPVTGCSSPQIPEGTGCTEEGVTYYSKCVCPSNYNQTCDGQNQQGVGTGCTQNGVTYYTSCQCKSGYNMTCSDLGPVTPSDCCLMNGIKYYNNCKTCENKCTLSSCPTGSVCDLEECSQKYCATEVPLPVLYERGRISYHPNLGATNGGVVAIVYDDENSLAIGLTQPYINDAMGAASTKMSLLKQPCDVPNLENCTKDNLEMCGIDGRSNTNALLDTSIHCGTTSVAADAVNRYYAYHHSYGGGCYNEVCSSGKWFLPSTRDLLKIYSLKEQILATASGLARYVSVGLSGIVWSSTEYDNNDAFALNMSTGDILTNSKTSEFGVLTIIKVKKLPILYGDGSTSKTIIPGKTAIGVVFDEENHLALALDDVTYSLGNQFKWLNKQCDMPNMDNCSSANYETCGENGRANTNALLGANAQCEASSEVAQYVNNFEPEGCEADFCKKGKWFVPSAKEAVLIADLHHFINSQLEVLKKEDLRGLRWTSTEYSDSSVWSFKVEDISYPLLTVNKTNKGKVRPVVIY